MIQIVGTSALKEPEFKDGDGGGEYEYANEVGIKVVTNGYLLTYVYYREEGSEIIEYVFEDKDALLKHLGACI